MGLWLLKHDDLISADNYQQLVTGFNPQGLTRLAGDHNLILA